MPDQEYHNAIDALASIAGSGLSDDQLGSIRKKYARIALEALNYAPLSPTDKLGLRIVETPAPGFLGGLKIEDIILTIRAVGELVALIKELIDRFGGLQTRLDALAVPRPQIDVQSGLLSLGDQIQSIEAKIAGIEATLREINKPRFPDTP